MRERERNESGCTGGPHSKKKCCQAIKECGIYISWFYSSQKHYIRLNQPDYTELHTFHQEIFAKTTLACFEKQIKWVQILPVKRHSYMETFCIYLLN